MCGPVTRMRLKNETKRGLKKEPLSSPNLFEVMQLRGISIKSLCPLLICLKFCLREVRSISQSFSDSQDRTMAQEKSILQIVTFDF